MGDERDDDPRPIVHADRTMQVDALTDVSLTDGVTEDEGDEDDAPPEDAPLGAGAAPPPLPPRRAASPARSTYVIAAVVVLAMAALGAGIAHFLVPPPVVDAPPVAAPAPAAAAPAPVVEPAAEPRRVHIGEIVIGGSTEGTEGAPAEPAPAP